MITKRSAKLSESCRRIKLVTSLLTNSKSAGNSNWIVSARMRWYKPRRFWAEKHGFLCRINCRNDSKSRVSTFKFPEDPKLRKEWLIKMKRESFEPTKHSRICADHFTSNCFQQNLAIRTSLGSTLKPRRLNLKKMQCQRFSISRRKENVVKNKSTPQRTKRQPAETQKKESVQLSLNAGG